VKKNTPTARELAMIGMLTAVLSVLSILQIPMPSGVPITLQTFAVALCGYLLGRKKGTLCVVLYLLLGIIGVPVFTGMTAGLARIFGFTGGFLYGFLFLAFFCGQGIRSHHKISAILFGLVGLLICHLLGSFHYSIIADMDFLPAFALVSLPYLLKDILSVIGAYIAAMILRKSLRRAGISF
jgi:biotin transport system substrate-specific component